MADAFPVSGSIDPQTFPFLVFELNRQGATGSLKVEGPTHHKALYFRGGRILFASSNDPKDQLGAILIESGKLTHEQLEDVNTKIGPGNPLAKVLSESGFVNNRELSEAARAKVERILSDVISYETGGFEFEDGVLPKGAVDLKLPTERVALTAVRRITDRGFVLRYIDDLQVVLRPTTALVERVHELQSDIGSLLEHLDGSLTLKEAAAAARLDEFDAAKIACALLFLGFVERVTPEEAPQDMALTYEDAPVDVPPPGDELDLSQTARRAFTDSDEPTATPPTGRIAGPEPPAFPLGASLPEPDPQPLFQPSSLFPSEPEPQFRPEPEPQFPPQPELQFTASPPEDRQQDYRQEEIPPAGDDNRRASDAFSPADYTPSWSPRPNDAEGHSEPDDSSPAASDLSTTAPSREELAALDTVLNAGGVEGPLMQLDKTPREGRPQPEFAPLESGASIGGGRSRTLALGIAAVLAVAALVAAWLYIREGTPPPNEAAMASPAAPPTTVAAQTPPPAEPSATLPTAPPPTTAARATPTPSHATHGGSGAGEPKTGLADARTLLQKGKYPEAARGFAANLKDSSKSSYSLQLLVACSEETVQKAVSNVSAQELFITPVRYKGRDCYRVCWGLYDSEGRAKSAAHGVPDYFRKGGARPKAIPTSLILH